jgi:hypothetical protein
LVNEHLKVQPVRQDQIDPRDLTNRAAYEPWIATAKLYGGALETRAKGGSPAAMPGRADICVLVVRIERALTVELANALRKAYRDLRRATWFSLTLRIRPPIQATSRVGRKLAKPCSWPASTAR